MEEQKPRAKWRGFLTLANLRDIVVIILLAVITTKLITADLSVSVEKFGFSEFLSILLAFFAISLSVAFYFKATETSNRFYDNVYKFTKDTSEILGRIEAGFGEKLRHIDEGNSSLRDKMDNIPFDVKKAKEEIEQEEEVVEKIEHEKNKLIEDLADKAKLAEADKTILMNELAQRDEEIQTQKRNLRHLEREIYNHETPINLPIGLSRYMRGMMGSVQDGSIRRMGNSSVKREFTLIRHLLSNEIEAKLLKFGIIHKELGLTNKGINWLMSLARPNDL